jgi:hypothetical protein
LLLFSAFVWISAWARSCCSTVVPLPVSMSMSATVTNPTCSV